jgi:hypothetical protein
MLLSNTVSISLRAKIEQLHEILCDTVRFVLLLFGPCRFCLSLYLSRSGLLRATLYGLNEKLPLAHS